MCSMQQIADLDTRYWIPIVAATQLRNLIFHENIPNFV